MIQFLLYIFQVKNKYTDDEVTVYAAQTSFFIILSAIPFIMVLLTVIQMIPSVSKADLLSLLVSIMPQMLQSMVVQVVDDLFTKSPGKILSITALAALWSASKGMLSMCKGLNRIYECPEKRGYLVSRLICTVYTFIFMVACVMSLVLLVFGTSLQHLIEKKIPILGAVTTYLISFRTLLSLGILTAIFMGFYTFIPARKQKARFQLPGAVFSTVCWIVFSFAFSIYFNNFSNYSYMYGSLTAIVLLMLWIYFCICILFLGAEINFFYEKFAAGKSKRHWERNSP